jgi:hypothetical protein
MSSQLFSCKYFKECLGRLKNPPIFFKLGVFEIRAPAILIALCGGLIHCIFGAGVRLRHQYATAHGCSRLHHYQGNTWDFGLFSLSFATFRRADFGFIEVRTYT